MIFHKRKISVLAVFLLASVGAQAVEPWLPPSYVYTTQKLYADLDAADRAGWLASDFKNPNKAAESETRETRAQAYMEGVVDALNGERFCTPPKSDLPGVVGSYIKAHMNLWNLPAAHTVELALTDTFPCRTGSGSSANR